MYIHFVEAPSLVADVLLWGADYHHSNDCNYERRTLEHTRERMDVKGGEIWQACDENVGQVRQIRAL
jgi:hypothetical protein